MKRLMFNFGTSIDETIVIEFPDNSDADYAFNSCCSAWMRWISSGEKALFHCTPKGVKGTVVIDVSRLAAIAFKEI